MREAAVERSRRGGFLRRFAFTLGVTVNSIADGGSGGDMGSARGTRKNLFMGNSLLLGAGFRLTDSVRLGAGAILFKKLDPNPLIDDETLTTSYYVNLSFDWDVLGFFKKFGPFFGQP